MTRGTGEKVGAITILVGFVLIFLVLFEIRDFLFPMLPYTDEAFLMEDSGSIVEVGSGDAFTGIIKSSEGDRDTYSICLFGSLIGPYKSYNSSRVLVEKGSNGRHGLSGYRYVYSENGVLIDKSYYVDGVRNGKSFRYNAETGALVAKGSYSDGEMSGIWSQYDKSGNLMQETLYSQGYLSAQAF